MPAALHRFFPRFPLFLLLLALTGPMLILTGCATDSLSRDETLSWSADKLYAEAKDEMNSGNWANAVKLLEKLESRYPFGRYAQQAQIDTAYSHWKQSENVLALAAIDRFMKLYPNHENVDYVLYLKGLINFNDRSSLFSNITGEDVAERDPKAAREAFDSFKELVTRFPKSRYADDAEDRMSYLINMLASNEVHVARFYMRRGATLAAINRAQSVVRQYQEAPAIEEALSIMMEGYAKLGLNRLSSDSRRVLETNFPASRYLVSNAGLDEQDDYEIPGVVTTATASPTPTPSRAPATASPPTLASVSAPVASPTAAPVLTPPVPVAPVFAAPPAPAATAAVAPAPATRPAAPVASETRTAMAQSVAPSAAPPAPAAVPAPAPVPPPPPPVFTRAQPPQQLFTELTRQSQLLVLQNQSRQAKPLLEQALEINPTSNEARQLLAHAHLQLNELDAAIGVLKNGLLPAGNPPDYHAFLAALLQRKQLHAEAVTQYVAALQRTPNNSRWYVGLGISLQAQNMIPAARQAFERALDLGTLPPDLSDFAQRRLIQLN